MNPAALLISHNEMRVATEHGRSRPLCEDIPELRRYGGVWWISSPEGWLRITDIHLAAKFDSIATRLDIAGEDDACLHAGDGRPGYRPDLL
jgi:hypothetical protein